MSDSTLYRARLVRDGVFVAVRVWFGPPLVDGEELDRSPRWQAQIDGAPTARAVLMMGETLPVDVDGVTLRGIEAVDEAEYQYLLAHGNWAKRYAPSHPRATPRAKPDLRRMPSLF